jgi:hypothetical protein
MAMNPDQTPLVSKVYYRPIEAAIRWCGLEEHEHSIARTMRGRLLPKPGEFPKWPALRINAERIIDAIANRELPFGIDGVTVQGGFRLDHPRLTIRHVDLRAWMARAYPHERPRFLFDPAERVATSLPSDLRAVIRERDELKGALALRDDELLELQRHIRRSARPESPSANSEAPLTPRAESTYLHIIGVMLRLMLTESVPGQRPVKFATQESVVNAMVDQFGKELMGITERTLHAKFAAANRKIDGR